MAVNVPIIEGQTHFITTSIGFVLWQLYFIFVCPVFQMFKNRKQYQFELWTLLILFAFFIVQGIFEPDLGTSIRHKIDFSFNIFCIVL
jgi:hypothetical protein